MAATGATSDSLEPQEVTIDSTGAIAGATGATGRDDR